jgi:hypothetical protein
MATSDTLAPTLKKLRLFGLLARVDECSGRLRAAEIGRELPPEVEVRINACGVWGLAWT